MMIKKYIIGLFFWGACTVSLFAQQGSSSTISKVGTTVAQFLKIGPSARAIAMGGAFTSIGNDISTIYWNVAGIARINATEAMFTHTEWIADTKYDFIAIGINLYSKGSIGFMVSSFNSGDMAVRTVEEPDGTGENFSTQDIMFGLSYARNLTNNFSIGGTVKYIHQQIWHMTASSFAFDIGTLFNTPFYGIRLGASMSNFGAKMILNGRDIKFSHDPDPHKEGNAEFINALYEMKSYSLPLMFQMGLSKDVSVSEYNKFTLSLDAIHPNDNYEAVNCGFEYVWKEQISLRAGYKSLFQKDTEEGLTFGAGVNYRLVSTVILKIDYAYADFGRLEDAQRFSLSIRF